MSEYSSSGSSNSDSSDSESCDGFEMYCSGGQCKRYAKGTNQPKLPFDPEALQEIILHISDQFNFRVILSDERVKSAMMITTGLTIAGSMVGKHYGGNLGAAIGGAVGGVCGLGVASATMREVWEDVKSRLSELYDIVYDYLAAMDLADYQAAADYLMRDSENCKQLAGILLNTAASILKKKVSSSFMSNQLL